MQDLRDKPTRFTVKKKKNNFFRKLKWKYLLYLILLLIIIFPEQSGTLIGQWISDFFVTIIEIIKNAG